ncbi:MAG: hypothetical protein HFH42_07380 [Lachnospiraceae bacterium]|nr:hypothetical protein [Lachnospiraceae bacterium]
MHNNIGYYKKMGKLKIAGKMQIQGKFEKISSHAIIFMVECAKEFYDKKNPKEWRNDKSSEVRRKLPGERWAVFKGWENYPGR